MNNGKPMTMRYKIRLRSINPKIDKKEIYSRKCYIGASLNNPFFTGKHFPLLIQWIDNRFPECVIIIGDYLDRYNELIFNKNDKMYSAIKTCLRKGTELKKHISNELEKTKKCKFHINHWLEYYNYSSFQDKLDFLNKVFKSHKDFKDSVLGSCREFIDRQSSKCLKIHVPKEKALNLSSEYIIEELAVFSILAELGFTVQVYPGKQLDVLKKLANTEFDDIDTILKYCIYIDLSVEKILMKKHDNNNPSNNNIFGSLSSHRVFHEKA